MPSHPLNIDLHLENMLNVLSKLVLVVLSVESSQAAVTSLYGDYFGVPGINATYDYVVSARPMECLELAQLMMP